MNDILYEECYPSSTLIEPFLRSREHLLVARETASLLEVW